VRELAAPLAAAAARLPAGTQLRFGFWGAEELGLYGSRHYVGALSRTERAAHAAYVNLDMVGTPNGSRGVYEGRDEAGRRIERVLRRALGGRIRPERLGGASDHAPFARAGIAVGGLFTGTDRCYHRACDTAEHVDGALLAEMTRAARVAVLALARG
jgi:aminopeptidase S